MFVLDFGFDWFLVVVLVIYYEKGLGNIVLFIVYCNFEWFFGCIVGFGLDV